MGTYKARIGQAAALTRAGNIGPDGGCAIADVHTARGCGSSYAWPNGMRRDGAVQVLHTPEIIFIFCRLH